jgi:hypothetical protein
MTLKITNLNFAVTASNTPGVIASIAPYVSIRVQTPIDLLLAIDEPPTKSSYLLCAGSDSVVAVDINSRLTFCSANPDESGEVRFNALAS